jgi:Flp pilus assembly protein TadD
MSLHARRPALAYFAEGMAYEQIGDFKDAYANLRKAHDLEPTWSMPTQELARYQLLSR